MKGKVKTQLLLGIFITLAVIILSSGSALAAEVSDQAGLKTALSGSDPIITLTGSFDLTEDISINRAVTISGSAVTLNTGEYSLEIDSVGHLTVDGDITIEGNGQQIILVNGGSIFTLDSGTIENTYTGNKEHCAIVIEDGGTVNINGGIVKSNCVNAAGAINTDDGIVTLNITGGHIQARITAIHLFAPSYYGTRVKANISGATISANQVGIDIYYGDVTIDDTEISASEALQLYYSMATTSNINTSGRVFLQGGTDHEFTNCSYGGISVTGSIDKISFTGGTFNGENTLSGGCEEVNITDSTFIGSDSYVNIGLDLSNVDKAVIRGDSKIIGTQTGLVIDDSIVEIECTENLEISGNNSIISHHNKNVLNSLPKPVIVAVGEIGSVDIDVGDASYTFKLDSVNTSTGLGVEGNGTNSYSIGSDTIGYYSLVLEGTRERDDSPCLILKIPVSVGDGSPDANFGIRLDKTDTHTFDGVAEGYASVTPLTVTINNTGNQPTGDLTVVLSGNNPDSYTISKATIGSIAVEESDSFTIGPKLGLSAGTYVATVTVSRDSNITAQTFSVSFTVTISDTTPPENNGGGSSGGKPSSITPGDVYSVNQDTGTASVGLASLSLGIGETVVNIPAIPGVNNYSLSIGASSLATTDGQGNLTLATDVGNITLPSNMLTGLSDFSGNNAEISIGQGDSSNLPEDIRAAIGDRPIISLALSLDGEQTDWNNPNAPVRVSIPYTPTEAEMANPESIVIWYIDGSGNAVAVPNAHYDSVTGTVTFTTSHFSDFAVTYRFVSFNDLADKAWYAKAVSFIAARDITLGTGDNNFNPQAKLTRGQFIVMLMRAYEIVPVADPVDNFLDAGNTYYTDYLARAKKLGITEGTGNNMFSPDKNITRQEMFTLLYNTLDKLSRLPKEDSQKNLADFTDEGQIASWARDAMTLLVKTGTVSGNEGKLSPLDTSSRAEMAQVLYNLLGN